jgi:hypothetical protein
MSQGSTPPPLPPRPKPKSGLPTGPAQPNSGGPPSPLSPAGAPAPLPARDLKKIAELVLGNPSVGKRILHSKFLSSHRSGVQSTGAAASYVASGVQKGVSAGLGAIPVPVVGSVIDKAWTAACEALRKHLHAGHIGGSATPEERVKFELKEIGDTVGDWDRYRWKITHAVEEYNKATKDIQLANAPCDTWVRIWVKYLYLEKRVRLLRASVEAVRGVLNQTEAWLATVETSYHTAGKQIESQYVQSVEQLKAGGMQAHEKCSDTKCMFKKAEWTSSRLVPTSDAAKYLVKGVTVVANVFGDDPIGDAIDQATKL